LATYGVEDGYKGDSLFMDFWKSIDPRSDGATLNKLVDKKANRATGFYRKRNLSRDPFQGILVEIYIATTVLQVILHLLPIIHLIKDYSGPTFVSFQDNNVMVPVQIFEGFKLILANVILRGA